MPDKEDAVKGWQEAVIAWSVCVSLHRDYCKKTDAVYTTRQRDFVKHAENARAQLAKIKGEN